MKNLVKGAFFAVLVTLFLASCNKDQGCINKLEGTWTVTGGTTTVNGTAVVDTTTTDASSTFTFTKFKLNDATEGALSIRNTATTPVAFDVTTAAQYRVSDDCGKFWWSVNDTTTTDDITADITSLTSSNFEYTYSETIGSDNYVYTVILTKD
ncbi:MAG: hypothetical protein MK212_08845 [Saprospiraceae bacterium]|nr:hypothetical protein [Saprospiraceae bacterium]